jgi:hypothetical protein
MPIIDRGWNRIKTNLYWLDGKSVSVGVFASVVGAHLALIAVANHEGTRRNGKPHIPSRPFLRKAFKKNLRQFRAKRGTIARNMGLIYRGRASGSKLLHELGLFMTTETMEAIQKFTTPHNDPATIARKGFDDPLVDTGRMATEGITYLIGGR